MKNKKPKYFNEFIPGKNIYITGTNQAIKNIHPIALCSGTPCVIHNPSNHHMRDWPTNWREDRRIMERMCPHGIGHPDPDDINKNTVHGCDGCCEVPK